MPPQVLAAAVVLQTLHGLSDADTVQALRCDLRWKAACGLGLYDTACDPSLLTYFRRRLARSRRPNRIFEAVGEVVAATGVLKGRQRRALDSAVLDDAVATQDTVTQLIAAIRATIRHVPGAAQVAADCCTAHDYGDPAHVAVEPDTGLFTAVALRPGSGAAHHEAALAVDLLAEETSPVEVFGDAAYSSGACRQALTGAGHRVVIKPAPLRPAVPGGFDLDDFAVDTAGSTVTFPAGHQVALSAPSGRNQQRKAFFTGQCAGCPLRSRCTKAKAGRILTIRPHHDELAAARRQAATDPVWQDDYRRWRPPVERAIAWIVARGNRRLRYIGTIKNNAWLHTRAALNLRTLINLGLTRTGNAWTLVPN
ncbi:transposase [Microbispora sp. CA-102843]|uniref:transposase n=1 Tax=Microbispora sp. CA-102843 TaxID=3239952 RepID=UPI003D928999